jgi:hypothetical protein
MTMSQCNNKVVPIPIAVPASAAIRGLSNIVSACTKSNANNSLSCEHYKKSSQSLPAQKQFSSP